MEIEREQEIKREESDRKQREREREIAINVLINVPLFSISSSMNYFLMFHRNITLSYDFSTVLAVKASLECGEEAY